MASPVGPFGLPTFSGARRRSQLGALTVLTLASAFAALVPSAAALASPTQAAAKAQTEVRISAGSAAASHGRLRGSVVVANRGASASGRFTLRLILAKRGRQHLAERLRLASLPPSHSRTVAIAAPLPARLPAGKLAIRACVAPPGKVGEHTPGSGCRQLGTVRVRTGSGSPGSSAPGAPGGPTGTGGPTAPGGPAGPGAPVSTVPTDPVPFKPGVPFTLNSPESNYWVDVPASYDAADRTPTTLFVWLHGCGGESAGDIWVVSPGGARDWISIAVGGREGECWDPDTDSGKVLAAIADLETHFNIDPHRVILGGYSSGGDLAYRVAFYDSAAFAGVLAENTSPFRDTGSTAAASLAAATVKFHVVHLAHLQDTTYPIAGVRKETEAMVAAGFSLTRIEVDGGHYDEPGARENGHKVPGTDADLVKYLLPHIDDGWRSP